MDGSDSPGAWSLDAICAVNASSAAATSSPVWSRSATGSGAAAGRDARRRRVAGFSSGAASCSTGATSLGVSVGVGAGSTAGASATGSGAAAGREARRRRVAGFSSGAASCSTGAASLGVSVGAGASVASAAGASSTGSGAAAGRDARRRRVEGRSSVAVSGLVSASWTGAGAESLDASGPSVASTAGAVDRVERRVRLSFSAAVSSAAAVSGAAGVSAAVGAGASDSVFALAGALRVRVGALVTSVVAGAASASVVEASFAPAGAAERVARRVRVGAFSVGASLATVGSGWAAAVWGISRGAATSGGGPAGRDAARRRAGGWGVDSAGAVPLSFSSMWLLMRSHAQEWRSFRELHTKLTVRGVHRRSSRGRIIVAVQTHSLQSPVGTGGA